jgi:putative transposase
MYYSPFKVTSRIPVRSKMPSRRQRPQQLSLAIPDTWGGRRRGAGRKRVGLRPSTPHRARPPHSDRHPVLITLRSRFRPLRSEFVLPTVRLAIRDAGEREPERFRIVHYSVQYDHMHLVVEARDKAALSAGMRSVSIRIARSVNALVGRRGAFWADRWYGRALTSPRQVRTALLYVLANFRKHSRVALGPGVDPFSSGAWFDGWQGGGAASGSSVERSPPETGARDGASGSSVERSPTEAAARCESESRLQKGSVPVGRPQTWLGRVGWRRHGLLGLDESPARATGAGAPGKRERPLEYG